MYSGKSYRLKKWNGNGEMAPTQWAFYADREWNLREYEAPALSSLEDRLRLHFVSGYCGLTDISTGCPCVVTTELI